MIPDRPQSADFIINNNSDYSRRDSHMGLPPYRQHIGRHSYPFTRHCSVTNDFSLPAGKKPMGVRWANSPKQAGFFFLWCICGGNWAKIKSDVHVIKVDTRGQPAWCIRTHTCASSNNPPDVSSQPLNWALGMESVTRIHATPRSLLSDWTHYLQGIEGMRHLFKRINGTPSHQFLLAKLIQIENQSRCAQRSRRLNKGGPSTLCPSVFIKWQPCNGENVLLHCCGFVYLI